MSDSSTFELALFAAASLGIVLSTRIVLRMMRSRATIARMSHRI
ncbi:hypothetical protein [Ferrovibrio sp.]|nr:hypothetical protein [Ferrovibrio sp.]